LVGGRQTKLKLGPRDLETAVQAVMVEIPARLRERPLLERISATEAAAHAAFVIAELGSDPVWNWA
jgi:hypothetical protein